MNIAKLALKSLKNRWVTALLTVFSIAVSVALLLGVERIRVEAKNSFTNTITGTDLIVGARSSSLNLLLYSLFHIGNATNNLTWQSYQELASDPAVSWTVPIALGDTHKGYRVVGTTEDMFERYRYAGQTALQLSEGKPFQQLYDAVIGSEVAQKLGYTVGEKVILSHGVEARSLQNHDDKPFHVSGILAPTGTPMDRVVLISLEGVEALHIDWLNGAPPPPGFGVSAASAESMNLQPASITAFMVGLKSRISAFRFQRKVNEYRDEPLTAILPGVALQELWQLVGSAEKALLAVSIMVVIAGLIGMLTTIITSLSERRREMAILRAVGARPGHVFALMASESLFYGMAGTAIGFAIINGVLYVLRPLIQSASGLYLPLSWPSSIEWLLMGGVIMASSVLGLFPARRAYQNSIADGLTVKL